MKFSEALLSYLIAYDEWKAVKGSKVYDLPRFKVVLEKGEQLDRCLRDRTLVVLGQDEARQVLGVQLGAPFASPKTRRPK